VSPFEEEEEGVSIASDVVKVQGEAPDTPGYHYLRGDRVRRDVGDPGSWVRPLGSLVMKLWYCNDFSISV